MALTNMEKLVGALTIIEIPYDLTIHPLTGTPQIWYPNKENPTCDVICHQYSYGGREGLLEIMGLVEVEDDDVEGYLDWKEVFHRIYNDYYTTNKEP